jgi:probable DNA metabolism protein
MTLLYDGTFEGFLTIIYEVYYKKLKVKTILKSAPQTLFLDEIIKIITDEKKALKVLEALKSNFPKKNFELILNIFMCDTKKFELELLRYVILGFKDTKELSNINQKEVFYLQNLEKELFRHIHKMYGFVRFKELEDNTLYAKIDGKFNITYFLGKHFMKRLNNQNFIIHDTTRDLAFIKNENFQGIEKVSAYKEPKLSDNENKFSKLWFTFFKNTTIKTRENKKSQRNFIPLIYRTYMDEFKA